MPSVNITAVAAAVAAADTQHAGVRWRFLNPGLGRLACWVGELVVLACWPAGSGGLVGLVACCVGGFSGCSCAK